MRVGLKLFAIGLIVLFSVGFYIDGFSYGKTCPICNGTGKVICDSCHGTGTCSWCGGTGKNIIFNPDEVCPLCDGTGDCPMCDGTGFRNCSACVGSGIFKMYSVTSATLIFFIALLISFFALFGLEYFVYSVWLSHNPWVRDVKEMHFWFNPMFLTWLFYQNRKRWMKWISAFCLIGAFVIVLDFALILVTPFHTASQITPQTFLIGIVLATSLMALFSLTWYRGYNKISNATTAP